MGLRLNKSLTTNNVYFYVEPMETYCLRCGKPLGTAPRAKEGIPLPPTIESFTGAEITSDDCYILCPYCSAKNVPVEARNAFGFPEVTLSHFME